MKDCIYIYRNFDFNGNIYVKFKHKAKFDLARVTLLKDGEVNDVKEIQGSFAVFSNKGAGTYQAQAEVTGAALQSFLLESQQIMVKDQPHAPKKQFKINTLNTKKRIYTNVSNHYLEVKIHEGSFDTLKQNMLSLSGDKYSLNTDAIAFEKLPDGAFITHSDGEMYKIRANMSAHTMVELAHDMECYDYVIYCSVTPDTKGMKPLNLLPMKNADQTPYVLQQTVLDDDATPDFRYLQGYLNAGNGMNVLNAWNEGITGHAATVRHLDFGVYRNHENLEGNITVVSSRPETDDCDHGTASTGCIAAKNAGFGVTGVAHDCDFYFYETDDIDVIVSHANPGDIVSLDIQFESNGVLLPAIDNQSWWDKINTMARNDVVVILAAGNGGVDLNPQTGSINDYGDSGSMLVGACQSYDGARADFSNYNHYTSYINSWGDWSVATTGYGTLQRRPGNDRNYCNDYAGTSSATPLSSAALALMQSYTIEKYGVAFNGYGMREIILDSGYTEGANDGIGNRPNIIQAFRTIDSMLS